MPSAAVLLKPLLDQLAAHANPENARAMKKYLRGQFEFYGIKSPLRRELSRDFVRSDPDRSIVPALWQQPHRECQLIACDRLRRQAKNMTHDDIEQVEQCITTRSWWDTVDTLAVNVIGPLCRNHPPLISSHIVPWSGHENFWLRRTAILFQLKYKQDLDKDLLEKIILQNNHSDEFFIQKAIGWVLRETAKTDPDYVVNFVADHPLARLSVHEAMKHLR